MNRKYLSGAESEVLPPRVLIDFKRLSTGSSSGSAFTITLFEAGLNVTWTYELVVSALTTEMDEPQKNQVIILVGKVVNVVN